MVNFPKNFKVGLPSKSIPTTQKRQFRFFKTTLNFALWFKNASSDKYFRGFFFIWLIPLFFTTVTTLINYSSLPREIPLFYSRVWGEAQLAQRGLIFLPTSGTFLLGIFNFSLAANFHQRDKVLSYFLAGCASLVSILSAITILNIIKLMI